MSFAEDIAALIAQEGPFGVDRYMALSNAHYYATRDPLGAAGDFTTAPEISQMFGELVGAALADCWQRAGAPETAVYAELGPGRGTLAVDALRVLAAAGFSGNVHLVETSPALRREQAKRLPGAVFHDDLKSLPDAPLLLVANEFFDALPVRQRIGDAERQIVLANGVLRFEPEAGEVMEFSPERTAAMRHVAAHLTQHGGAALIIDYGYGAGERGDTLQAVKAHQNVGIFDHPGEADLTAHVDFAALAEAARGVGARASGMLSQGGWLEILGLGARAMALAAKNPGETEAIAAARRRLSGEDGMGRLFKVIAVHHPAWPAPAGLPGDGR